MNCQKNEILKLFLICQNHTSKCIYFFNEISNINYFECLKHLINICKKLLFENILITVKYFCGLFTFIFSLYNVWKRLKRCWQKIKLGYIQFLINIKYYNVNTKTSVYHGLLDIFSRASNPCFLFVTRQ